MTKPEDVEASAARAAAKLAIQTKFHGRYELLERHIEYDTNGGCWLWNSPASKRGYGKYSIAIERHRFNIGAHQFGWIVKHGHISPGLQIMHKCDVPLCVNPDHLALGTNLDNVADRVRKGRSARLGTSAPRISDAERESIIELIDGGASFHRISEITGRSRFAIRNIARSLLSGKATS